MKSYNVQIIDLRGEGSWDTTRYDVGTAQLDHTNFDFEVLRDNITEFAGNTHGIALICDFNDTCNHVLILLVKSDRTDYNNSVHLVF